LASAPDPSLGVPDRPVRVRIDRSEDAPTARTIRPGWKGLLAIAALVAVTIVAAESCQQSQVRLNKEQAISKALPQAGFTPERTQVRLVRQGLNGHPFWAVSFSVPAPSGDGFSKLTTVRVDANSGTIDAVNRDSP
jgi:hypothetical protein